MRSEKRMGKGSWPNRARIVRESITNRHGGLPEGLFLGGGASGASGDGRMAGCERSHYLCRPQLSTSKVRKAGDRAQLCRDDGTITTENKNAKLPWRGGLSVENDWGGWVG